MIGLWSGATVNRMSHRIRLIVCLSCVASASLAHGAQTKTLLINGSFEEGQDEPLDWNRKSRHYRQTWIIVSKDGSVPPWEKDIWEST